MQANAPLCHRVSKNKQRVAILDFSRAKDGYNIYFNLSAPLGRKTNRQSKSKTKGFKLWGEANIKRCKKAKYGTLPPGYGAVQQIVQAERKGL
jgi:hypothetical protein